MTTVTKIARLLYIAVAFSGSWLTSPVSPLLPNSVDAQNRQNQMDSEISRAINDIDADRKANSERFDGVDKRLNDVSERVANIQGIGFGAFSLLGVLQIAGMIGAKRGGN